MINLHLVFNFAVVILALPLVGPMLALASRWVREPAETPGLARTSALDSAALADPNRALACVARAQTPKEVDKCLE